MASRCESPQPRLSYRISMRPFASPSYQRRPSAVCQARSDGLIGADGIWIMGGPSPSVQKAMLTPSSVRPYWTAGSIVAYPITSASRALSRSGLLRQQLVRLEVFDGAEGALEDLGEEPDASFVREIERADADHRVDDHEEHG